MTKYVVGPKILKKEQVLISIFLIAILVISSGSMVAFASSSHTIVVKPSGDTTGAKDTVAIQAALNACTKGDPQCTVQLVKGTYTISSQITVYGFQGSFIGAGQGQTNIIALGNMPSPNPEYDIPCTGFPNCNPSSTGTSGGVSFWAGLPGPSNPWPDLFTFVGGLITISGMTITDTSPTPTQGWYLPVASHGGSYQTALEGWIEITGVRAAATIDHLTIIGGAGDAAGWNSLYAIEIAGWLLPSGWTDPVGDSIQLTGAFAVTDSIFTNVLTGPTAYDLVNSQVVFCGNTFTTPAGAAIGVQDISNTNVLMCRNQGSAGFLGNALFAEQSVWKSGLLPSTVTIANNDFQVNTANGVFAADLGQVNFGTAPTLNVVISGNTFQNSFSCVGAQYPCFDYSAIFSLSLKNVAISGNTILAGGSPGIYVSGFHVSGETALYGGPGAVTGNTITGAYAGVWIDYANGVQVSANAIKNSLQYGIAVTDGSSNNVITANFVHGSGAYDLYDDQTGTGNVWHWNFCQISSPPGLC